MQQMVRAGVELVTAAWRTERSIHGMAVLPIELNSVPVWNFT